MSGKVIKTLSNIRFRRVISTPCRIENELSGGDAVGTVKPSVPYVFNTLRGINTPDTPLCAKSERGVNIPKPQPDVKVSHPFPPLRRPIKRHSEPDKDTIRLIDWFRDMRHRLPTKPFDLAPWIHVADPQKFYSALDMDIRLYPRTPRARALADDLRMLQSLNST